MHNVQDKHYMHLLETRWQRVSKLHGSYSLEKWKDVCLAQVLLGRGRATNSSPGNHERAAKDAHKYSLLSFHTKNSFHQYIKSSYK